MDPKVGALPNPVVAPKLAGAPKPDLTGDAGPLPNPWEPVDPLNSPVPLEAGVPDEPKMEVEDGLPPKRLEEVADEPDCPKAVAPKGFLLALSDEAVDPRPPRNPPPPPPSTAIHTDYLLAGKQPKGQKVTSSKQQRAIMPRLSIYNDYGASCLES